MTNYTLTAILFAIAVTIHNLEEAIWLPNWSQNAGRWHKPVDAGTFRFAVTVLTFLAYCTVMAAIVGGKQSIGAYLLAGYALAMCLNVFLPHLAATFLLRKYAPGIVSALLLNLPITILHLKLSVEQEYIRLERFYVVGPVVVVGILLSIPVLFAVGGRLFNPERDA